MTRTIKIGDEEMRFNATAALPLIYRNETGRDFFADLQKAMQAGISTDVMDMAWVMYKSADNDNKAETIEDWLGRFSFADFNEAIVQIISLLSDSQATTSTAKKKNAK